MSFPLYPATERQKRLVTLAGELANVFASRANEDDWQGQFPYENYKDLRRSGLLGLTVPRDLGGWGVDLLELTLTLHRLAQGCASTALVLTMHLSAIGRAASECSKFDERFADICHAVIHDSLILNVAATEPATGSPSRGGHPTTTACRQADGSWLITGRKTYTTGSNILGAFIISSSIKDDTPPDAGLPSLASNQGAFLIPRDSKGVRVEETWHALSMRSSASNDLILENVHVGQEAYVPELFSFTPAAQQRQAAWILPLAAVYLGIAQAARDEAIRFARQRRPNSLDQPISSLPHI